ncbi:uncharacterized protein LOC124926907 [Impatiens glandulifera]|uniref:uncharacterized protein LOC124926907 n=1 Tax=Impatiens glandulifera TaxID=253017 RepID=UPI001FB054E0|nr:uncharacterized protein LOC124926907 [Impatiens glandulifera]
MSNQLLPQTLISTIAHTGDSELEEEEDQEEEELENLEAEVKEMAQRILEYRTTMPEQFKRALESTLSAQRPFMPAPNLLLERSAAAEPSSHGGPNEEGNEEGGLVEEDKEILEKAELVKRKNSKNLSSMPVVMKRMKECMARIDKLEETRLGFIHPAFRKKKTTTEGASFT